MKRFAWALTYGALLTAFTGYAVLDTFLLPDKVQTVEEPNTSMFQNVEKQSLTDGSGKSAEVTEDDAADAGSSSASESQSSRRSRKRTSAETGTQSQVTGTEEDDGAGETQSQPVSTADSYSDENMTITLTEYDVDGTAVYVADVRVTSAEYIRSAFAQDTYGKNITAKTSETAAANGAVLAVNGDYYGVRERGYVIRNGVVYRDSSDGAELMCLYADGTMRIVSSNDKTAQELVDEGVWQAWDFGPALVVNGEIAVSEGDEVGKAMASNPRTAIGMIDSCHYLFVVSDGRTSESEGLSLYELAAFMESLGAETVYNLDGGGSSAMYFNGRIVNNPTTNGRTIKERGVSDIVYVG